MLTEPSRFPEEYFPTITQVIKRNMIETLQELQKHVDVGVVGGSDLKKIEEQLTQ